MPVVEEPEHLSGDHPDGGTGLPPASDPGPDQETADSGTSESTAVPLLVPAE